MIPFECLVILRQIAHNSCAAVQDILNHSQIRDDMVSKARLHAEEKFAAAIQIQKIARLYKKILAE